MKPADKDTEQPTKLLIRSVKERKILWLIRRGSKVDAVRAAVSGEIYMMAGRSVVARAELRSKEKLPCFSG